MERHAEASGPYLNAQSALLSALKKFGNEEFANTGYAQRKIDGKWRAF
jgi:hypothetical protein